MGGTALFGKAAPSVIKSHHAFDDGHIGVCGVLLEQIGNGVFFEHEAVEVAGSAAGSFFMVHGVNIVGTDFKRLYPFAFFGQRRHQRHGKSGLAAVALGGSQ